MNPYEPVRSSQHHPDLASSYHSFRRGVVLERLREPSVVIPVLLLVLTIIYHSSSNINHHLPRLVLLVWDGIVSIVPARLLYAVDGWLNPPLFPRPMPPAQSASHAAKSDVLRRILGIDAGIMASVSQAGRRLSGFGPGFGSGPSLSFGFKADLGQPAGLGNVSNSCYQNSILQGLASLKPLPGYLGGVPALASSRSTAQEEEGCGKDGFRTAGTLRDLIADLNSAANNGRTLWTPTILKNMSTWQQQDAQEYFSKLLDEVDREIGRAAKSLHKSPGLEGHAAASPVSAADDGTAASLHSDDSGYQSLATALSRSASDLNTLRNPLEGMMAQRVACVACGWSEGLSMIPFNCITLSLGMDQHEHDLFERLDAYTKVEAIPGVECGKCTLLKAQRLIKKLITVSIGSDDGGIKQEAYARMQAIEAALEDDDFDDKTISQKCKITQKVSSTKTKQAVIARAPRSLVVHMNRSVFDETTGQMFKNPAAVRFPMVLDLGPWCLGSAGGSTSGIAASGVSDTDADSPSTAKTATAIAPPPADEEERWLLSPTVSMVAGDQHPSKITGPIYELRAVVTHYGRHENGHYVCYRKHPRQKAVRHRNNPPKLCPEEKNRAPANLAAEGDHVDEGVDTGSGVEAVTPGVANPHSHERFGVVPEAEGEPPARTVDVVAEDGTKSKEDKSDDEEEEAEWWRLSDQNVTKVSEASVLSQGGVFMLFYDCTDPVPVLTSEVAKAATQDSSLLSRGPAASANDQGHPEPDALVAEAVALPQSPPSSAGRHDIPLPDPESSALTTDAAAAALRPIAPA